MATVFVGSNEYTAYATDAEALEYLAASLTEQATAFAAATPDTRAKGLIEATRVLDRQTWKSDYDTFAEREVVTDIVNASIELAALLVNGDTDSLSNASVNSGQQKRLKAGSVEIDNYKVLSSDPGARNRFPLQVQELLKPYLGATVTISGGSAGGVSRETAIETYTVNEGL